MLGKQGFERVFKAREKEKGLPKVFAPQILLAVQIKRVLTGTGLGNKKPRKGTRTT